MLPCHPHAESPGGGAGEEVYEGCHPGYWRWGQWCQHDQEWVSARTIFCQRPYDSVFRNSSQVSQSWDSNNDDKCWNVVRTVVGIICLKGWSTLCVLFSCSHRCWHQRSGGDAGRPGVRLRLGSVSVPAAALAGTRTVVLRPHVQLPVLFFLQELCLHAGALLVRLLLWFLSSGKDNGASHKVCTRFSFLYWAAQKQLLPWFKSVLFPQTVYDQWFITLFNIVYTSLPVLAMGLFDQVKWSNKAIFSHF